MDARKALDPVEFQFTAEEDVAAYGDRWYRYAEADFIRLSVRELIELEDALGMPIVDAMNGMRMSSALGDAACTWLGVRQVGPKLAGSFDDWNPHTMMVRWRPSQAEGKDQGPEPEPGAMQPAPAAGSPDTGPSRHGHSGPRDLVVLQTLPISE